MIMQECDACFEGEEAVLVRVGEMWHDMQAMDARRFAHDPNDATARQQALFAEQANAALAQTPGHPVPLEEQVLS